jgi:HEAT repeat protein
MAALLSEAGEGPVDQSAAIVDLIFDPSPQVASAAREALVSHRREPAVRPLPERLRRALFSGVGERPVLAARALGALRDVESIPILIQALESGSAETAGAAAEALAGITMQRHGPSAQKWLRWWKENRGRSRAEWLFAALTSPDRELRLAASGELRSAAEPPVRYSADLPSAELEAAARAWWVWWSRQGISL